MASTNYPGSLDAYPVPNTGDTISVADHWLGPAVIGIETELGTDPAGSHTNVKDRLDQVDSAMGFKNRIIGGNFSTNPWQRGTSFTGVSGGSYTADRFVYNQSTTAVVDIFKTADAPTVSEAGVFTQHCLHLDVTTSDVMTGTEYSAVNQRIEGYNVSDLGFGQSGTRYFTLSFWHKHTKTGTNCVSIQNSAQTRSYVAEYTQSVSDTWEKAEITIPVDTSGTWLYDNGIGMFIWFTASSGSANHGTGDSWQAGGILSTSNQVNNLDSTSNNFKIALVQLEAGDKATRFETRSVGQELELCQRYYYRQSASPTLTSASGGLYNTANGRVWAEFPVTMRSNPSLEIEDLTYEIIGTGSTTATSNAGGVTSTHGASWDGLSISVTGYNGQPFAYIGKWNVLAEL
jgi:hypothetical protein